MWSTAVFFVCSASLRCNQLLLQIDILGFSWLTGEASRCSSFPPSLLSTLLPKFFPLLRQEHKRLHKESLPFPWWFRPLLSSKMEAARWWERQAGSSRSCGTPRSLRSSCLSMLLSLHFLPAGLPCGLRAPAPDSSASPADRLPCPGHLLFWSSPDATPYKGLLQGYSLLFTLLSPLLSASQKDVKSYRNGSSLTLCMKPSLMFMVKVNHFLLHFPGCLWCISHFFLST